MENTIISSIPTKSNIAKVQLLKMTITFLKTPEGNFSPNASFDIIKSVNLKPVHPSYTIQTGGSIEIAFTLEKELADRSTVSFDIVPHNASGFLTTSFSYTVVEIDNNSLSLTFGNEYLNAITKVENVSSNIPPTGKIYSKVFATIKAKNGGQSVSGIPITIMSDHNTSLDNVRTFRENKSQSSEITKKTLYNRPVFYLETEQDGMVVFYVYPDNNTEFILNLQARVTDTQSFQLSKNSLFVIDDDPTNPGNLSNINTDFLAPPSILEVSDGALIGDPDSTTFSVEVDPYNHPNRNDTILFYVNGSYSNQKIIVENKNNLGNYFIDLPYSIIPKNENIELSYIVVTHDAKIKKSASLGFTYSGGGKSAPLDDINRIYDPCVVYSSFGASQGTALIHQGDLINYFSISHDSNKKKSTALFIEIEGTNDITDKTKVPLGYNVVVTLYIDSYNKQFQHSFKVITMPATPVPHSSHTATHIFEIPIDYLNNIESYPNSSAGNIYFDYYAYDPSDPGNSGTKYYGKIWQGKIDTERP
ncbi:hypothetical protein XBJ2_60067 [Xenorhabdus bovienii str. Jollieti]|uniref:Uncharacterized protein n=1 Tax=Xenorhabdus bovienii (strain SS-2004) TaxID=406818 RepID=D3UYJ0_XENBS|nr:hypothetical protein [Xenorhabdus bovienii]CBJ79368.1 hypothetical protein XBJ1_0217 [Xenorhabdus bovienii SS-2004]CDH30211.1 hypothetical protein XBJ2_60067 [Xenorhabdus bovienii str. Jollieti]